MFKCNAKLFLSASNNISYAKDLINKSKKFINEYEAPENNHYVKAKQNINNCNIEAIVDKVEETKNGLLKLDHEFAAEYTTMLQETITIGELNYQNMSDEQKLEYSVAVRDYDYTILYVLEQYEAEDKLNDELKAQLDVQRIKIKQYELDDQMAILDSTSQEYINKFKEKAQLDRELINKFFTGEEATEKLKEYDIKFNSSLDVLELNHNISVKSDELNQLEKGSEAYYKKENEIRQLQIDYYNSKGTLTEEEKKFLQFQKDYIELNNYYIDGDEDKALTKKTKMIDPTTGECIATADEIAYENADWWGRTWMNTKTVLATAVNSIGGVGETLVDGAVMLTAGTVGFFNDDVAKWTEDFVSVDTKANAYDGLVQSGCLNSYSAYSDYHTVTDFIATTGTYVGISLIPGVGGSIVMAAAGAGSTAQTALANGATFNEALGASWVSGILSFAADYGLDKLNASSLTTLGKTLGRTVVGVGEPALNTISEYAFYGHENSDSVFDYAEKTGAYTNMLIGGTVANVAGLYGDYKASKNPGPVKSTFDATKNNVDVKTVDVKADIDIDTLTHAELEKVVKAADDVTLASIVKKLDDTKLKNLANNSTTETLGKITKNLDDAQLRKLAEMVDINTSSRILSVLDENKVSLYLEKLSNTKVYEILYSAKVADKLKIVQNLSPDFQLNLVKNPSKFTQFIDNTNGFIKYIDLTDGRALKWTQKNGMLVVDIDWPKYGGMDVNSVQNFLDYAKKHPNIKLDRIGGFGGGTYALLPESGIIYTPNQRAIFNNMNNPNNKYRQIELDTQKYISFCDAADDMVQYAKTNKIDPDFAINDSILRQKMEMIGNQLGIDMNDPTNIDLINSAVFGQSSSYYSDTKLKADGTTFFRDDIAGVEKATGITSKYGYVGTAAEWKTPDGIKIADGGAIQFNLRAGEGILEKLGIMQSIEVDFK